jgi:hypothetical protein
MNPEARPALKSLTPTPDRPGPATPAGSATGSGAPKAAARQGVPSAGGPDRHAGGEQRLIGWLHIGAPPNWGSPVSATSHCDCGRHITAHGRPDVLALVKGHAEHRTACPLHTAPERRQAA